MVERPKGERPASSQDATSPAKSEAEIRLRDASLSVTVFSRPDSKGDRSYFVVPERSYRDGNKQWQKTHLLHPEDLLPMALLLQRAYSELREKISEALSKKS